MEAISLSEARRHLAATLDLVTSNHEPVIITRRNGKAAVILSLENYNAWQEKADLLQSVKESPELRKPAQTSPSSFAAAAAKYLGIVEDAPPDLSTNPAYLDRFGQ